MADFQSKLGDLDALNTSVVAGSIDPPEEAQKTIDRHTITFPVACNMDAVAFGAKTGAFWDADKHYIHGSGFILRPDRTVAGAVYSTGPIGRYNAAEVIGMIKYWQK